MVTDDGTKSDKSECVVLSMESAALRSPLYYAGLGAQSALVADSQCRLEVAPTG